MDHGSESGHTQVLHKASKLPEHPRPTCPTEPDLTVSALPALTPLRLLFFQPQAAISASHRRPRGWFLKVLLNSLLPTTAGNPFPMLPLHQQSRSLASPGRLNMRTKLGWGVRTAPRPTQHRERANSKFVQLELGSN